MDKHYKIAHNIYDANLSNQVTKYFYTLNFNIFVIRNQPLVLPDYFPTPNFLSLKHKIIETLMEL